MMVKCAEPGSAESPSYGATATERAELAGRILADLGALVIKVEPPGGAASRRLPPFDGDTSLC